MSNETTRESKLDLSTKEQGLLEQILSLPVAERAHEIESALHARIEKIENLLPDYMKGQGERLVRRAMLTFSSKTELQDCTPASFVKCVLEAAEQGYAIDGRLAHAVPYNNKVKIRGSDGKEREVWRNEAQCQFDYKAILATAKRLGLIQDGWARLVHENDSFTFNEENGVSTYHFTFDHRGDRGQVVGAFSVARHKDGWHRMEWMSVPEINRIRDRSKSFKSGFSPWKTDEGEMQKKTVIKRLLKTFSDDPVLLRMQEIDDQDTDLDGSVAARPISETSLLHRPVELSGRLKRKPPATHVVGDVPDSVDEDATFELANGKRRVEPEGSGTSDNGHSPAEEGDPPAPEKVIGDVPLGNYAMEVIAKIQKSNTTGGVRRHVDMASMPSVAPEPLSDDECEAIERAAKAKITEIEARRK